MFNKFDHKIEGLLASIIVALIYPSLMTSKSLAGPHEDTFREETVKAWNAKHTWKWKQEDVIYHFIPADAEEKHEGAKGTIVTFPLTLGHDVETPLNMKLHSTPILNPHWECITCGAKNWSKSWLKPVASYTTARFVTQEDVSVLHIEIQPGFDSSDSKSAPHSRHPAHTQTVNQSVFSPFYTRTPSNSLPCKLEIQKEAHAEVPPDSWRDRENLSKGWGRTLAWHWHQARMADARNGDSSQPSPPGSRKRQPLKVKAEPGEPSPFVVEVQKKTGCLDGVCSFQWLRNLGKSS